ncbi:MAG: hypothetical protein LW713_16475 [Acetobacteraceae bacterium]|nr:hypothetical protein [Acetobacteraceae bacterium]
MQSEDLIHRLANDLRPVRPARPPGAATGLWLGLATAVIIGAVLFWGLRHDLAERLASGFEAPQLVTFGCHAMGPGSALVPLRAWVGYLPRRWQALASASFIIWMRR